MKMFLFLICCSSLLADQYSETQELVLHCRGAVSLAKVLAQEPFTPSLWSLGEVTTTDAGTEDYLLPSDLQGERDIRKVHVVANSLPAKSSPESKRDLQFLVKGEPRIKNAGFLSGGSGSWRLVRLKKWRWYDMPGLVVFRFAADAKDEKALESPCKLPRPWAAFFKEAAALRQQHPDWFSTAPDESALIPMRNAAFTTTNPLWRLCLTCRLIGLKQLRREDEQNLLKASAGSPLELGALLTLLLKNTSFHEEDLMEAVNAHGRTPGTAEGLALGCLISAADKPKAIERAFDSMKLVKELKTKGESSTEDKEKLIDAAFQGGEVFEFRVAHKLKLRLTGVSDELRQKVEAILYFMMEP
jgi:hypothetical protein